MDERLLAMAFRRLFSRCIVLRHYRLLAGATATQLGTFTDSEKLRILWAAFALRTA